MAIHIDDDFVSMGVHGSVAAILRLRRHGRQTVTALGLSHACPAGTG